MQTCGPPCCETPFNENAGIDHRHVDDARDRRRPAVIVSSFDDEAPRAGADVSAGGVARKPGGRNGALSCRLKCGIRRAQLADVHPSTAVASGRSPTQGRGRDGSGRRATRCPGRSRRSLASSSEQRSEPTTGSAIPDAPATHWRSAHQSMGVVRDRRPPVCGKSTRSTLFARTVAGMRHRPTYSSLLVDHSTR